MKTNFNKYPTIKIPGKQYQCQQGWRKICVTLANELKKIDKKVKILLVETYHGVYDEELISALKNGLNPDLLVMAKDAMLSETEIKKMVYPDITDDRIFGFITRLRLKQFFQPRKLTEMKSQIYRQKNGLIIVYGTGAHFLADEPDILVYADMARWEIQQRFRRQEMSNLGINNRDEDFARQYKQGFFVDWRVCDKVKKRLFEKVDFVLDTNQKDHPKMISGKAHLTALCEAVKRPFSVVPFFDPAPWGGQWMKKVCGLDESVDNFGWCFNCVPEENSLLIEVDGATVEIPSINIVFYQPRKLLGEKVHARFGDEFPIRFDFLDTMEGGNLSLQVHPLTEYIQEHFGIHYTQDESYYMMAAESDAVVYLGLRDDAQPQKMMNELRIAQNGRVSFDADKHVQTWPVKKHDHYLIPGGTVHCSGKNSVVLEISATPYIFTFKLWDWDRLGLDGKPRPINIDHGERVIQWERTKAWTKNELVNQIEKIAAGDGWREERTGLHEREFIETRRHWFTKQVSHNTNGNLNVMCLVEGEAVIVKSPKNKFEPFIVYYAETFIIPGAVGAYNIQPYGKSEGKECATVKAFVRG
jgi:mannose-6-phosphate isomerase class I